MPAVPPDPLWIVATVPKRGNRVEENEDATAAAPDALRFAVADGATEGWESGPWAARLVAAYIDQPPAPDTFTEWLTSARAWAPPESPGPVPWYAEEKREQGSFATLLGLELRRSQHLPGWLWRVVAVGDSCALHVRDEKLIGAVPLSAPEQFGNRPKLVPSAARACPEPGWFAGRAEDGDLILLATDAAAARLLALARPPAAGAARPPAAGAALALAAVRCALKDCNPEPLAEWCRTVQDTTNDDVSVLAIALPPAPEHS
jgi:hypothetical protein